MKLFIISIFLILLAGCASNIPDSIRVSFPDAPTVTEVRSNPGQYIGRHVRWGGQLVSVTNEADRSLVEIVSRNLFSGGRPRQSDYSDGRFIAILPGFIDPATYSETRDITVFGTVSGALGGEIGHYAYQYPLVLVSEHVLWQPIPESHYHPTRFPLYDPWYDPWHRPWHRPWPKRHQPLRY